MTRYHKLILLLCLTCLFKPFSANAQFCGIGATTITTMPEPAIGAFNLWDSVFGLKESDVDFVSAIQKDAQWLVAGNHFPVANQKQHNLLLINLDNRGRELWHKIHEIKGLTGVKKILSHPKGIIVLATQKTDGASKIWIGFTDLNGALLSSETIGIKNTMLIADDMVATGKKGNYAIAAHVRDKKGATHSRIYQINTKGRVIEQRSFKIGIENKIEKLSPMPNRGFIALGSIHNSFKRNSGWAIAFSAGAKMLWQKTYPRGLGATLKDGQALDQNNIIVTGSVRPINGGPSGAWIASINNGGDILWEHFYQGTRAYEGQSIVINDNLASIAFNGYADNMSGAEINRANEQSAYDFVRMITMNKRGVVMNSEDYLNGHGANLSRLISGDSGRRVIIGKTQSPDTLAIQENFDEEGELPYAGHGWLMTIPAPEPFTDPCEALE